MSRRRTRCCATTALISARATISSPPASDLMMSALPIHDLPLFMAAGLLLNLTPGPDMLFVAGSSAAQGRRAGVMAALGVGAGCVLHMVLATIGLSALLATSALAFEVVKWVGAAYLVWIGIG